MVREKFYDRSTKRAALSVWAALCLALLGLMLLPLYLYWNRLAARPQVLAIILCSLAWALFNWWKLSSTTFKGIRTLPERER